MEFSGVAKSTAQLQEAILSVLNLAKKEKAYIADRGMNLRFGQIFMDGMNSYTPVDLFVERIYKPQYVSMLTKSVKTLNELDRAIVDLYSEEAAYIQKIADGEEEADEKKLEKSKMIISDLDKIMPTITLEEKSAELPFFVNKMTNEETPLLKLEIVTDEALEEWAEKLTSFTECFKSIVTPMFMNEIIDEEGMKIQLVNNIYWYDLIVR